MSSLTPLATPTTCSAAHSLSPSFTSAQLADAVKEHGCDATYLPSFAAIEEFVTTHCQPGDLLITMGAGDVVTIGEDLLKA